MARQHVVIVCSILLFVDYSVLFIAADCSNDNSELVNGTCYTLIINLPRKTWNEAQQFCIERGGDLATVNTRTILDKLGLLLANADNKKKTNANAWIGGLKNGTVVQWNNGEVSISSPLFWPPNEPDEDNKCCLTLQVKDESRFYWNDEKCTKKFLRFFCEFDIGQTAGNNTSLTGNKEDRTSGGLNDMTYIYTSDPSARPTTFQNTSPDSVGSNKPTSYARIKAASEDNGNVGLVVGVAAGVSILVVAIVIIFILFRRGNLSTFTDKFRRCTKNKESPNSVLNSVTRSNPVYNQCNGPSYDTGLQTGESIEEYNSFNDASQCVNAEIPSKYKGDSETVDTAQDVEYSYATIQDIVKQNNCDKNESADQHYFVLETENVNPQANILEPSGNYNKTGFQGNQCVNKLNVKQDDIHSQGQNNHETDFSCNGSGAPMIENDIYHSKNNEDDLEMIENDIYNM